MADFLIRFNDWSGGDWGEQDPSKAKSNQFSGKNVDVYKDGLIGPRPGWKLMSLTGKVFNPPATYSGVVRGLDVVGAKLVIALDTKTYDIWWDLSLAPGGTLPANAAINLPGGIAPNANAVFLRAADTVDKEFLLIDGLLRKRAGDPTGSWGPVTTPAQFSVFTRWGLYLVAVDKAVPWRIWFSQVNDAGPNFDAWPANNFLYVGTTEPITTLLAIFNMLYAGRLSGWWGVSGVLGQQATVRELAIGNGPLDQRAASVTTDNRVVYWPLQKVPAFWNGERVQLVDGQRMDPRITYLEATPVMAREGGGQSLNSPGVNPSDRQMTTELQLATLLRQVPPVWNASPLHTGSSTVGMVRRGSNPRYSNYAMPAGWTTFALTPWSATTPVDPGTWTADAGNQNFTPTASSRVYEITGFVVVGNGDSDAHILAIYKNGVVVGQGPPAGESVTVRVTVAPGDQISMRFYNGLTDGTIVTVISETLAAFGGLSPFLFIREVPTVAAGARWVCPATGAYDLFARIAVNWTSSIANPSVMFMVNGHALLSALIPYGGAPIELALPNLGLAAGDEVSLGVFLKDSADLIAIGPPEDQAAPMLRITQHGAVVVPGQLDSPADSVVVTPTERRLMMVGSDGAQTKLWNNRAGVWTRHFIPMVVAGLTPSDVRDGYQLPERTVFATKRLFEAEPLKVWSVMHDVDRPAFLSDTWASPYDEAMPVPGGQADVMVKGELTLPSWFDGQGRQVMVRSVIVQFRKWDQGVVGGLNSITARVDSLGPYDGGVQTGLEAQWSEPMSAASNQGTDDSWRFGVGEQGWGNGFQLVFTGLYGVAIREVVVAVEIRTERT